MKNYPNGFYVMRFYGRGVRKQLWMVESVRFRTWESAEHWMGFLKEETPKWKDDYFIAQINDPEVDTTH